jgi:TP901 family phage tail tape measure protein
MADRVVKYVFTGSFTNLTAGLTAAGRSVQDFGNKLTALDKDGAKMRAGLDHFGRLGGRIALGVGAGLAATAKAAIDWESAWAGVRKTVDGTAAEMAELESGLRNLAKTMPATHEEIAATAEAAGQLGVAREDVVDFTRTMLQLGETTNLTADQAATAIAQFMNVMGTSGDKVDEIGAALVDLGNKGASTEAEILALAQRLSGAGALVGAAETDILALASSMANLGVQAELGGGAIQRVFIGINTAVSEGGDKLAKFAQVSGVSAQEFAAKWQSSPVEAFDLLLQGLNGVQASGGNVTAVLEDLGIKGTQNLQVMLRLAGAGDMLTESLDQSREAWSDNTALVEEYQKRMETTGSQVRIAWNNIKDAAIEAGAVLLPIVGNVAGHVADLAKAFGSLPGPVKNTMTSLAGVAGLFGAGLWVSSKIVGGIADTRKALQDLGVTAGQTQAIMQSLGKGASLAALLTLLPQVQKAVDDLLGSFDIEDSSGLARDLATLLNTGEAVGEIENLDAWLRILDNNLAQVSATAFDWMPFDDSSLTQAEESLKQIDMALANMVESGAADDAAAIMAELESRAAELGTSANQLPQIFTEYAQALENAAPGSVRMSESQLGVARSALEAWGALHQYKGGVEDAGGANKAATKEVNALVRAMREQTSQALGAFDAVTQWGQAVADARAQAKSGEKGLDALTEAGRNNRNALSNLAATWNDQPRAVKNSQDAYRNARKTFIDVAEAMGVGEDKAKRLADRLLEVPRRTVADVVVNTDQAYSSIGNILAKLRSIDGTTAVTYIATRHLPTAQATGGPVVGPGGPTDDKVPIWGSNGEFMMSAAAVNHYGLDTMFAMNARRLADGGPTTGPLRDTSASSGAPGILDAMSFNQLGQELRLALRNASQGMGEWTRELRAEMRQRVKAAQEYRDELKKDLEAVRDHRNELRDAARSLRDSIADKFSVSGIEEGTTLASLAEQFAGKANEASLFAQMTLRLKAMGLDGAALQWLLENSTAAQLQGFVNEGAGALGAFEANFNDAQSSAQMAGGNAANAVLGEQLRAANKELAGLRAEFKEANQYAKRLENRVEVLEKSNRVGHQNTRAAVDRLAGAVSNSRGKS